MVSPNGRQIVYWQAQAVSPACGGSNPLPCYNSTEPDRRDSRIMLATLTSRLPLPARALPKPFSDSIPWAVLYTPGLIIPAAYSTPREGVDTLKSGEGYAQVVITENAAKISVQSVDMQLFDFLDQDGGIISGLQDIGATTQHFTLTKLDWYANLTRSSCEGDAIHFTSADGFHTSIDALTNIFEANGTLTTIADSVTYEQPLNGA